MNIVKSILAIAISFYFIQASAQSTDNKVINNLKSSSVMIESNYPNIELKSWDEDAIKLESTVSINEEYHNGAYTIETKNTSDGIYITAHVDTKSLKRKMIINNDDGSKTFHKIERFENLNIDRNNNLSMDIGFDIKANIVIWLPMNMNVETSTIYGDINTIGEYASLDLHSTYGLIEAKIKANNNMEKVNLSSIYDIVDVTLDPNVKADLTMSTPYGEMYTDLKLPSMSTTQNNHCGGGGLYTINGGGTKISLSSIYDNIYLRSLKSL